MNLNSSSSHVFIVSIIQSNLNNNKNILLKIMAILQTKHKRFMEFYNELFCDVVCKNVMVLGRFSYKAKSRVIDVTALKQLMKIWYSVFVQTCISNLFNSLLAKLLTFPNQVELTTVVINLEKGLAIFLNASNNSLVYIKFFQVW